EVEVLGQLPTLLADLLLADHDLELAAVAVAQRRRPVPQIDPVDLAAVAAQDDAPGDLDVRPLSFGQLGGQLEDVGDGRVAVETAAPGVEAERLDGPQLVGTAGLVGVG